MPQALNSGNYSVRISNALGQVTSAEAGLIVAEAIQLTSQPASNSLSPDGQINLSVGAVGNPAPNYQWQLNGVNIPGAINSTLMITNAQPTDFGIYSVVIANVSGITNSGLATVLVSSPRLSASDTFIARNPIALRAGVFGNRAVQRYSFP